MAGQQDNPNSAENRIIEAAAGFFKTLLVQQRKGFLPLTFQFNETTQRICCLENEYARISADYRTEEELFDFARHFVLQSATNIGGLDLTATAAQFDRMTFAVEKRVADELNLDHVHS